MVPLVIIGIHRVPAIIRVAYKVPTLEMDLMTTVTITTIMALMAN
jgi:hypothetical protein